MIIGMEMPAQLIGEGIALTDIVMKGN